MKPLPKKYKLKETENRWQEYWLASGIYNWDESAPRAETYVIDTPPPTVSGHLHMGHVFSYTQADFIARWQRMNGKTVFYPMGFDDNGLPTERLVEKTTKKRAADFANREEFIEACMQVSAESRKAYRALFQSTALSVDWRQEYHTISDQSRKLSQMSFIDLYNKGHIERRLEPMLWDVVDQTAIAQAEIEDKNLPSNFCSIKFPLVAASNTNGNSDDSITIATTRPELIPACVAIFYNPQDERYQHLAGKYAKTPLFDLKVPILADDTVEMDKGTGIMMCCTFGDEADIDKWRKHKLPTRIVINKFGKIEFTNAPDWIANKKIAAARDIIIQKLEQAGYLLSIEPITHMVKCAERSGAALEILPTPQWFVKVIDKKEDLKRLSAQCNWYPTWMAKRMEQWIDGLSWDWCISRQRYFGVPFPVWYSKRKGEEGKVLLAELDQLPCNPLTDLPKGYSRDEVEPDIDVMDTWNTSSISPQLNSRAISEQFAIDYERHTKLYPADLRPQAHEIIRSWAFYTLVKSYLHSETTPWHNLMISGWCLAEDKQKMSKSKGNVITPIALIEEHGADVVRYWAATSKLGQDTAFSRELLKIGKKLITKLWNATKFAAIHLEKLEASNLPTTATSDVGITATIDKWILSKLHKTIAKSSSEFAQYEYANALRAIEDFFWNDFCDNYLELVKKRVYDENNADPVGQTSAVHTIYHCLDAVLRLFAPILPHITEELWSHIFPQKYEIKGSIHARGNWPDAKNYPYQADAELTGQIVCELLEAIRKAKSERALSIKWPIVEAVISANIDSSAQNDLRGAGNINNLSTDHNLTASDAIKTESGKYSIKLQFADNSDAA